MGLTALGLEINVGFCPGGTLPRDFSGEFIRIALTVVKLVMMLNNWNKRAKGWAVFDQVPAQGCVFLDGCKFLRGQLGGFCKNFLRNAQFPNIM